MRRPAIAALVVAVLAMACGGAAPSPPPGGVLVVFEGATVVAEVAATPEERQLGLMHRESLDADAGMLFLFPAPSHGGFWMKDTLVPLSIAYGRVDGDRFEVGEILDMEPCEPDADPCPTYPPSAPYDAALEVNQGWFERHGLGEGDIGRLEGDLPTPR